MSDYNSLKAAINANIRKNGRQEITGQVLNGILRAMVDALGAGFTFRAVASPDTDPGSTDSRVFYVATTPGAYEHMGGIEIEEGEVAILKFYDDEWHKEPTGLASQAALESLGNTLGTAIGEKMTFCELWCDGDKITRKDSQIALSFAEVKELMDDPSQFVALKYIDVFWMLPQYDDEGGAIIFTGVSLMSAQGGLWRVAINEENQISDYSIAIENQYLKTDDLTEEQRGGFKTYPTTQAVNAALDGKVDKVPGKGLSANDFTTHEKNKLAGLNNYDDTELRSQVQSGVTAASGSAAQAAASAASAESKYAGILQAMENLPDGSAVSAQVALNTQKATELEKEIGIEENIQTAKVNGVTSEDVNQQVGILEEGVEYNISMASSTSITYTGSESGLVMVELYVRDFETNAFKGDIKNFSKNVPFADGVYPFTPTSKMKVFLLVRIATGESVDVSIASAISSGGIKKDIADIRDSLTNLREEMSDTQRLNLRFKALAFQKTYLSVNSQRRLVNGEPVGAWFYRTNILHISDSHEAYDKMREVFKLASDENLKFNAIIDTGDYSLSSASSTQAQTAQKLAQVAEVIKDAPITYGGAFGNHDILPKGLPFSARKVVRDKMSSRISWGSNSHAYGWFMAFANNYAGGVKVLFLDTIDVADSDLASYGTGIVYSQEQINWLINQLKDCANNNYGAIIVQHYIFGNSVQDYTDKPNTGGGTWQPWNMIPEIVQAIMDRTTLNKNYTDTNALHHHNITINEDFSTLANPLDFICYLGGHKHSKGTWIVQSADGTTSYNQVELTEDSLSQEESSDNLSRVLPNTINDIAFSALSIDRTAKKIYRTYYGHYTNCDGTRQNGLEIINYRPL